MNNVLGFPYLFRGALDIHARAINDEMKIACAEALAELAREDVPDEVAMAYGKSLLLVAITSSRLRLIRVLFIAFRLPWLRPVWTLACARRPIVDMEAYELGLKSRMDPTANILRGLNARARGASGMIFAEGDDPRVLRAAVMYQRNGMGKALVVGRENDVREKLEAAGMADAVRELEVVNAANTRHPETYKDFCTSAFSARALTVKIFTGWRHAIDTYFRLSCWRMATAMR